MAEPCAYTRGFFKMSVKSLSNMLRRIFGLFHIPLTPANSGHPQVTQWTAWDAQGCGCGEDGKGGEYVSLTVSELKNQIHTLQLNSCLTRKE